MTDDLVCSVVPYFKVQTGKMDAFKKVCERFVERTKKEEGCLYYGFCFFEDIVHCREAYKDGDAALFHLEHVGDLIEEALTISDMFRLEIHGPESEISKLRGPLADKDVSFYVLEYGFRN